MQKDTKTQTIAEFIAANGGVSKVIGRAVTNGKNSWLVHGVSLYNDLILGDQKTAKVFEIPFNILSFISVPGLRLKPQQVSVHQYAVKAKGRHAEVSAKHFASKEEAVKYYERLTSPGSVEWAQKLRHTEETRTEPEETPEVKKSEE